MRHGLEVLLDMASVRKFGFAMQDRMWRSWSQNWQRIWFKRAPMLLRRKFGAICATKPLDFPSAIRAKFTIGRIRNRRKENRTMRDYEVTESFLLPTPVPHPLKASASLNQTQLFSFACYFETDRFAAMGIWLAIDALKFKGRACHPFRMNAMRR